MQNTEKNYTRLGRAVELSGKNYLFYRLFEIIPGVLSWGTLLGLAFVSWSRPLWVAFFIIAFDLYWLLKTLYLSLHLRASFRKMQQNLKVDWLDGLNKFSYPVTREGFNFSDWKEVWHLIILPMYKESLEVMRGSLRSIADSRYPKERLIVILSIEERAGKESRRVGERLREEFSPAFGHFLLTLHSADIEGEMIGKGSNEVWAIQMAKEEIIDRYLIPYERIIVSSFDADTQVYPNYFARLTHAFLSCQYPYRSSFQPIPIFNNNIWESPLLSRIVASSSTFWQMMQQERKERLVTFSSHSVPFQPLVETGWWQTNVVSEDSRIFWQLLLWFDGDWRVEPLYYPVSMDANVGPNPWQTIKNIYKQQRRWAYGVENFSYAAFGFLKNWRIPLRHKLYYLFILFEGFWSWSTNALMIFMLGWLPVFIGGWEFRLTVLGSSLPTLTRQIMMVTMFGLVGSAIYSFKLLPAKPPHIKGKRFLKLGTLFQWILLPVTLILFGSFPALDAQTRLMLGRYLGFWVTPKWRARYSFSQTRSA